MPRTHVTCAPGRARHAKERGDPNAKNCHTNQSEASKPSSERGSAELLSALRDDLRALKLTDPRRLSALRRDALHPMRQLRHLPSHRGDAHHLRVARPMPRLRRYPHLHMRPLRTAPRDRTASASHRPQRARDLRGVPPELLSLRMLRTALPHERHTTDRKRALLLVLLLIRQRAVHPVLLLQASPYLPR